MDQPRKRLLEYPPRFRARVAGRVIQVTLSGAGSAPCYEAVIEVGKSSPLPPSSAHQLTGIPIIEVLDEEVENTDVSAEDDDDLEQESVGAGEETTEDDANVFPQYRVHTRRPKTPAPLYPNHPPLVQGAQVRLIWQGQKDVPGIIAGTYIRCSGMLTLSPGSPRIYNPRYEIVPLRLLRARQQKKFQRF